MPRRMALMTMTQMLTTSSFWVCCFVVPIRTERLERQATAPTARRIFPWCNPKLENSAPGPVIRISCLAFASLRFLHSHPRQEPGSVHSKMATAAPPLQARRRPPKQFPELSTRYEIRFLHPGYHSQNLLLTLPRVDSTTSTATYGVHHITALLAC